MINQHPAVFCHGLFGWGDKAFPINYLGGATGVDSCGLPVFKASVGPVSSFHDRACELAAQIKGTRVDYGQEHAAEYGHERFSVDYSGRGFHPDWSENNSVHLIGHNAGAHTILRLQYLLSRDYWGWRASENKVKSISALYILFFSCDGPY